MECCSQDNLSLSIINLMKSPQVDEGFFGEGIVGYRYDANKNDVNENISDLTYIK